MCDRNCSVTCQQWYNVYYTSLLLLHDIFQTITQRHGMQYYYETNSKQSCINQLYQQNLPVITEIAKMKVSALSYYITSQKSCLIFVIRSLNPKQFSQYCNWHIQQ